MAQTHQRDLAEEVESRASAVATRLASIDGSMAVDVLTPERQREIDAVVRGLARFEPTVIAVEWPAKLVDER